MRCLFTRRGFDWTHKFPLVVEAASKLRARSVIIDGEAVYCNGRGISDFAKLHSQMHNERVFLYAFDLLEVNNEDCRQEPLEMRKAKLEKLLGGADQGMRLNEHIEGDGGIIFKRACQMGLEGIVSKHRERAYRTGRRKSWIKVKNPASPAMLRVEDGLR